MIPSIDFSHFYDVARYIGAEELCCVTRSDNAKMYSKAAVLEKREASDAAEVGGEDTKTTTAEVRQNFSETAFFFPGLLTDDKGNVQLQFTLPESVTTWQLRALAHDEAMNNGTISATSVAKKTVMVQPNVPRFVRRADKGVLSARIFNTSEKQVGGTVRLAFLNPETEKEVWHKDVKFMVEAGGTSVADFAFDMSKIENDGLLVCRVTASGR